MCRIGNKSRAKTVNLVVDYGKIVNPFSSLSRVRLFVTPWIAARQASLSITNSRSSLKLMCIESVMWSSHLILCRPLLLPLIPPSIRVFSNESTLCMRWPKYQSFSLSIRFCYFNLWVGFSKWIFLKPLFKGKKTQQPRLYNEANFVMKCEWDCENNKNGTLRLSSGSF